MSEQRSKTLREELKATLDESEWGWLAPHLVRDALILISNDLDLLLTAEKLAQDDKTQVNEWIQKGQISKPTVAQIEAWTKTPEKKFLSVIVQPYVLIQEHLLHWTGVDYGTGVEYAFAVWPHSEHWTVIGSLYRVLKYGLSLPALWQRGQVPVTSTQVTRSSLHFI
jgi:hypothetical protein